MAGLPAPGRALVEVSPVVSVLLELLEVALAELEVELVVVRVVVVVLTDVVRKLPQATTATAVRMTAARRATVVAEPGRRIEDGARPILEPGGPPRLRMRGFLQLVVE
jgi:hypothetical protein